jgi:hypothetical protein
VTHPFSHIPPTPHGHFLLHFYGAVLRLLLYIDCTDALDAQDTANANSRRYPFLDRYREEIERFLIINAPAESIIDWWEDQIADWEKSVALHLPLAALGRLESVGQNGRAVFMLAGLVQEDSRFGTLLAHLQQPLPARRLTLGMVSQLLASSGRTTEAEWSIDGWAICRGLFRIGAMEATNPTAPRSEWMLQFPPLIWDAARGSLVDETNSWCVVHAQNEFLPLEEMILPEEFLHRLHQAPAIVADGKARTLVLRGTPGSERLPVAGALARAMGQQVIEVLPVSSHSSESADAALADERRERPLGALCTLANAMPIFTFDLGPGETATLPELKGYAGPAIALMGLEGGLRGNLAEKALTLTLPPPDLDLRLRFWRSALGSTPTADLNEIAARFILPGGYIRQTASMAVAQAGLEKRESVNLDDVRHAARTLNRQMLDSLADRIEGGGAWGQLVVGAETLGKLRELQERCIFRERLLNHLGSAFGSSANRGVRALLSGSSGTGKTLAARILAGELGMDLYRVDLASVINKYIGETEKNLHRVLSRAEELDVILLIDEGDALLGSRTDVKSSNDRYANLETNYLLQRLESYQGIVLITTNAAQNIDTAFQRRMDVVVNFVPPGTDERMAIWQLHLPKRHAVHADFLSQVAARCDLTGGQIRNAALLATLLAVGDQNSRLQAHHLEQAVRAEYRKAGAVCPLQEAHGSKVPAVQLGHFIRVITQFQP